MGGEQHGENPELRFESLGEQRYVLEVLKPLLECDYPRSRYIQYAGKLIGDVDVGCDETHPVLLELRNVIDGQESGEEVSATFTLVEDEAELFLEELRRRARQHDYCAQALLNDYNESVEAA